MAGFNNNDSSPVNKACMLQSNLENATISTNHHKETDDANVEYPVNTKPLQNQVAGHAFKDGKCTIGMLKHSDGYVLKPVNQPIQGAKEIKFYEEMQGVVDPILIELKSFIPEYYGTSVLDLQGKKVTFLLLKDITNGFEEPCIMDIKIGRQTWEPGAPVEKQQSEQEKYAKCKKTLCFCIPGFQIYDFKTGKFQKYGKDYGKQLDADGVYDALRKFFNAEHGIGEYILTPMLSRLKKILKWWKKQNHYHIYASSVLLAYDAAMTRKNIYSESDGFKISSPNIINHVLNSNDESTARDPNSGLDSSVCVYLIDFAHVVPADKNVPDFNYINGLVSLIRVFENLLTEFRLQKMKQNVEES